MPFSPAPFIAAMMMAHPAPPPSLPFSYSVIGQPVYAVPGWVPIMVTSTTGTTNPPLVGGQLAPPCADGSCVTITGSPVPTGGGWGGMGTPTKGKVSAGFWRGEPETSSMVPDYIQVPNDAALMMRGNKDWNGWHPVARYILCGKEVTESQFYLGIGRWYWNRKNEKTPLCLAQP
jgi:hypothetical protein